MTDKKRDSELLALMQSLEKQLEDVRLSISHIDNTINARIAGVENDVNKLKEASDNIKKIKSRVVVMLQEKPEK